MIHGGVNLEAQIMAYMARKAREKAWLTHNLGAPGSRWFSAAFVAQGQTSPQGHTVNGWCFRDHEDAVWFTLAHPQ